MTASEVLSALAPSRPFIRGLTVSGGECTLYPDFLTELFTLARAGGLGCLLDSNGMVPLAPHRADGGVRRGDAGREGMGARRPPGPDRGGQRPGEGESGRSVRLRQAGGGAGGVRSGRGGRGGRAGRSGRRARPQGPLHPVKLITFRPNGVRGALAGRPSPTPEQMTAWRAYALGAGLAPSSCADRAPALPGGGFSFCGQRCASGGNVVE